MYKIKKRSINIYLYAFLLIVTVIAALTSCVKNSENGSANQLRIDSLRNQITTLTAGNEMITKNLTTFDSLDYTVFSNQEWTRLHESHAKDIKVNWPDGHIAIGIEKHIADLKALFVYAPNTAIKQHPIRFGSGEMTCVTGVMTGNIYASNAYW